MKLLKAEDLFFCFFIGLLSRRVSSATINLCILKRSRGTRRYILLHLFPLFDAVSAAKYKQTENTTGQTSATKFLGGETHGRRNRMEEF
jgi:hypothetical protein